MIQIPTTNAQSSNSNHSIKSSYHAVQEQIDKTAHASGRLPEHITLVVVTKNQPLTAIQTLYNLGHRHFGENRIEEASGKITSMTTTTQPLHEPITWHMIGHIQSRKAHAAVQLFDQLHSIDSIKLANRLSRFAVEENRIASILLQCNISGESTKSGFATNNAAPNTHQWSELVKSISTISILTNLRITGLMTMAPIASNPENSRPVFHDLRLLSDQISHRFPELTISHLSMGMSIDYAVAIQEGATMVRVGTSIFG